MFTNESPMETPDSRLYYDATATLRNPKTTAEEVQEIFSKCWKKRFGRPSKQGDVYIVPLKLTFNTGGFSGLNMPMIKDLQFPKAKLTSAQIELLEDKINSLFGWW